MSTGIRILIAEEQQECCELFKRFLQRCGYDVTAVHDGISCIEALNDGPVYDVLILSWELPWGEGEGVLDWMHHQGVDDIAVVILTARMDADDFREEQQFQKVKWVQRPFRLLELLDAVRSIERVHGNSWRILEQLLRKSSKPANGVLFDSAATTTDCFEPKAVSRSESRRRGRAEAGARGDMRVPGA